MCSTEVKVPTAENFYSGEQNLELDQNYQVRIPAIKFQDSICLSNRIQISFEKNGLIKSASLFP